MLGKFKCLFNRHSYYVITRFSRETRKVGCRRCNKQWGMNDRVKSFVPWDDELDEFYATFGELVRTASE